MNVSRLNGRVVEGEEASEAGAFVEGRLRLHHEHIVDEHGAEGSQHDDRGQLLQVSASSQDVEAGWRRARRLPPVTSLRLRSRPSRAFAQLPGARGLQRGHQRQHHLDAAGRGDARGNQPSSQAAQRTAPAISP